MPFFINRLVKQDLELTAMAARKAPKLAAIAGAGFTLIELLVVIAIIGILASIVLVGLSSTRVKSRDTKRFADMKDIQKALELYNTDNGHYPNSNGHWTSFDSPAYKGNPIISPSAADLTTALSPYFKTPPKDPSTVTSDAGYLYFGDGTNYCVLIYKTPENMNDFPQSAWNHARCTTVNSSGQCTAPTTINSIYVGAGSYLNGC